MRVFSVRLMVRFGIRYCTNVSGERLQKYSFIARVFTQCKGIKRKKASLVGFEPASTLPSVHSHKVRDFVGSEAGV